MTTEKLQEMPLEEKRKIFATMMSDYSESTTVFAICNHWQREKSEEC